MLVYQRWYLLKMFDHCIARIALSWNDNVSSVYRIAFAEREWGRKQRDFASKNASILFQNLLFSKSRIRYRWEFGAAENWRVSVHELNITIVKSHFDPNKFREYFNWKHSEKSIGSVYRSRVFMRVNMRNCACHLNACILPGSLFFFAFTMKKKSDVIGLNRLM